MPDSREPGHEAAYTGADWIGMDWTAVLARRDRQIRALHFGRELDLAATAIDPIRDVRDAGTSALVRGLRIENVKSLAGPHEVPMAPLTLIYGPNAAGKSTVLNSLRLMRDLLEVGRQDALTLWQQQLESGQLADMMTEQMQFSDPEERREFESGARRELQNWKRLALGLDFQTRENGVARAEVACRAAGRAAVVWHRSSLGMANGEETYRKEFEWSPPSARSPWAFGESTQPSYEVRENGSAGIVRTFDSHLFAHPSEALQEDLFSLMYFLHYLGPHRGNPADGYEPIKGAFRNRVRKELRSDPIFGDVKDWDLGNLGRFEYLNQMLSQLDIPYEFVPTYSSNEIMRPEDPSYLKDFSRSWHLRDLRSRSNVKLNQIGYGVSQLLPVIDACVHARQQVICVEEPELHLHPRLQAKLGNLFATSAITFGNQVIVETHSESILLRIRRLIRAGKLLPDHVSVLYVDNGGEGANVRRLRLGEHGELLDPWPTGFFDDSLSDVLGITE